MQITGTLINYYFHCHRQVWLFGRDITMEHESDVVYQGKLIHNDSYDREKKEIEIDNVKLDFFDIRNGILHEVKKSRSFEHAHQWQTLYYLYVLKNKGVHPLKAQINYPVLKKVVDIELTDEKENQLETVMNEINNILALPKPPAITVKMAVCRKCSYFELCHI